MVTEKVGSWGRREEQREGVMSFPRETVAGNGPVKNRVGTGREKEEIMVEWMQLVFDSVCLHCLVG